MAMAFDPQNIDAKWQQRWADDGLYSVSDDDPRPKWYALTMFPYTSGDLHIGHWYAMAPSDVHARFKRMQGYNVLHPIGFDAFGLPAENAAIKHGVHPFKWTLDSVANMRRQLRTMGAVYDWDREVITCLPEYYRWTQWFFLKFYQAGLAYRAEAPVNWCPNCQTVLANEQVVGEGVCDRCGTTVQQRDLEQWFFRITKYADELRQHEGIDWPERIKAMQRNWVGKSYGTEISFELDALGVAEKEIRVFTTRPDTTYGVTFMVLAPENPLVMKLATVGQRDAVAAYVAKSRLATDIERLSTEKEKDGVFTGAYCTNRLTGDKVPIWIADYVLASYGTGAVMAVPAHDERDFAFAAKYDIPVKMVISPPGWQGEALKEAYIEPGLMVNSAQFDGAPSAEGNVKVSEYLEAEGWGKRTVSYRIRDWLISRQRYWGAPIPIVYCNKCGAVPVPEADLPVLLPEDAEFRPTGESPLKYHQGFVNTICPNCGGPARRETDTMDTFLCSSWYFLRYLSPHDAGAAFSEDAARQWLPVDLYTGGAEHAVMHLLYARFFTKAMRDIGLVEFGEPFKRLFNQGTIIADRQKMSKSRGNVVNPDEYVSALGVDAVRAFLMFLGPWEQGGDWNDNGLSGVSRWLNRVWNLVLEPYQPDVVTAVATADLVRLTHQTVKKVTGDFERIHFNTMIAALMEYTNALYKFRDATSVEAAAWQQAVTTLMLLLAPTAPHITEELWELSGHPYSVHQRDWPVWDAALAQDEEVTLVVQVNGKLRDRITVAADSADDLVRELALASPKVRAHTEGRDILKVVVVGGKLVNLVVR